MANFISIIREDPLICSPGDCKKDEHHPGCEGTFKIRFIHWNDFTKIAVLMLLSLILGICLISTTVMISKDGVFYISLAQKLAVGPITSIKLYSPGFVFLIFGAQKVISTLTNDQSLQTWIFSGQIASLLCKTLAIIPFFFIGKMLVGSRNSFFALLALTFLPVPNRFICDIVREWTYLLFLMTGFAILLWSAKNRRWWGLGLVGLITSMGCLIRYECAQLIVYALLWVGLSILKPKLWPIRLWKKPLAVVLLLVGFVGPVFLCRVSMDDKNPLSFSHVTTRVSDMLAVGKIDSEKKVDPSQGSPQSNPSGKSKISFFPRVVFSISHGFWEMFQAIGENLMWAYYPFVLIGLVYFFRTGPKLTEMFFVTIFMLLNISIIIWRYLSVQPVVSKRWCLGIVCILIFFIPDGLRFIANKLDKKFPLRKNASTRKIASWFSVLFLGSIIVCMPKLLTPVRADKQGFREASDWLRGNTSTTDIIAVPDHRIAFYAERIPYVAVNKNTRFIVKVFETNKPEAVRMEGWEQKFATWVDRSEKTKKIVVFERKN